MYVQREKSEALFCNRHFFDEALGSGEFVHDKQHVANVHRDGSVELWEDVDVRSHRACNGGANRRERQCA